MAKHKPHARKLRLMAATKSNRVAATIVHFMSVLSLRCGTKRQGAGGHPTFPTSVIRIFPVLLKVPVFSLREGSPGTPARSDRPVDRISTLSLTHEVLGISSVMVVPKQACLLSNSIRLSP